MDPKKIATIAKLLSLAERAGTPEEAKVATEKAERLMLKYGIEEAVARAASGADVKPEEIVEVRFETTVGAYRAAQVDLMYSVALGMGLSGFRSGWAAFYVVGHESDVERYGLLMNSLNLQALTEMKRWWKGARDNYSWYTPHQQCEARCEFIVAFGHAVKSRLKAMNVEETEAVPGSALVLRNREKEIADHLEAKDLRGDNRRQGYNGSNSAGAAAGRNANLGGTGISGGSQAIG